MSNKDPSTFHIGLTMAGAASAGCYTAGTMDYFFEILDLWEKAKNRQLTEEWANDIYQYIPDHKVSIDVMGGTSAGGMTTVMAAIYAMKGKINPVKNSEEKNKRKNNIFYDSWVLMGDDEKEDTPRLFEKTFNTSDLDSSGKIQSLLNSAFIDAICEDAFKDDVSHKKLPSYISEQLEVLLSHTMLRSIPLAIDFTTPFGNLQKAHDNPAHNSFEHFTISHFKLDYNAAIHSDKYLPLDPFGSGAAAMKVATKATGAFPVGLRFREFIQNELSAAYLQQTEEKIIFERLSDTTTKDNPSLKWPKDFPSPFHFVSIDGGAINNEPFGEVMSVLKNRYGKKMPGDDYKYALIMIDPFPDVVTAAENYKQPDDLFTVIPAIIGTLWDQAKIKRAEMLDAYSSDYYRGQIYPVRWKKIEDKYTKEPHPIACGAAMAFGGFFEMDFRHHDFFLGRDNAKNFLRVYFTLEYYKDPADPGKDIIHPIHRNWTKEMIDIFKITRDGKTFLPVIPDLHLLKEKLEGKKTNPYLRTVTEWPQYNPEKLFSLRPQMEARIKKMMELIYVKLTTKQETEVSAMTLEWMGKYYQSKWWKKITAWLGSKVLSLLFKWNKGKIAARISKMAVEWMLKDLERKGLLKKQS